MNTARGTIRGRGSRGTRGFSTRKRPISEDPNPNSHAGGSKPQPLEAGTSLKPKFRQSPTSRPRPTHFIAIPLNTNKTILDQLSAFQKSLLEYRNPDHSPETNKIRGLDPSIVVDPRRFHFTLGVMALEESAPIQSQSEQTSLNSNAEFPSSINLTPPRTVQSALTLLRSLKPAISNILAGGTATTAPLRILLDKLNIMDPVASPNWGMESSVDEIWARVLYLAPSLAGIEGDKLRRISVLVENAFKDAGYITDTRPLKLHCTVLNTSYRRPSRFRGEPFSYSDILKSGMVNHLSPTSPTAAASHQSHPGAAGGSGARRKAAPPSPVSIHLGSEVDVQEIGLWIMGSRGANNEYLSCGGVKLV